METNKNKLSGNEGNPLNNSERSISHFTNGNNEKRCKEEMTEIKKHDRQKALEGIIAQKKLLQQPCEQEQYELSRLNANDVTKSPLSKMKRYEDEMLIASNVEVFSDEVLTPEDIQYIASVKQQLDKSCNTKKVRVIILNPEHWQEINTVLGRDIDHQNFNGRATEYPIVPEGVSPFVLLPAHQVFEQDTAYKKLHLTSEKAQMLLGNPETNTDYYRGIYLRNILSHEMAHLYQFSAQEVLETIQSIGKTVSIDGKEISARDIKYNEFINIREFLSCALGLYQLKKYNPQHAEAFLEACKNVVQNNPVDIYRKEQARRSLDANLMLSRMFPKEIDRFFQESHAICQGGDNERKRELQDQIEKVRKGELSIQYIP